MERFKMNQLKSKVINAGRYLEQVFEKGFETYDQFQSFCNMCENHVDMCNFYCKQLKPKLSFIQRKRAKIYNEFRSSCAWTVEVINDLIQSWKASYDAAIEEAKQATALENRIRLEHEISIEYQKVVYEDNRTEDKKPYCGFKTAANQPKKRRTNKKKNING